MRSAIWIPILLAGGCGGGGGSSVTVDTVTVDVDGMVVTRTLSGLWRDHYDLSYAHMSYAAEPGFTALVDSLQPRSWRCSVGRWEVSFPPPVGGDSTDPAVLRTVEREYYRGPNTLAGADDPANYDFTYLDGQLAGLTARGAVPFLCFDYMPFTLSSEQDPLNANNYNLSQPGVPHATYSFSNGIRTAPPADPAVYARVVRNVVRHVRGLFAGGTDFGVGYVEVGNEPDLVDGLAQPFPIFWTGDRTEWIAMYDAVAMEIDGDPSISALVELGGGSFAYQPHELPPIFLDDFLAHVAVQGTRLDFISFHSYGDDPAEHLARLFALQAVTTALALAPDWINAEWGRALDGLDPVYDTIEHGLFRAKVLLLMEVFGVVRAHEALVRDPFPGSEQLGLVRTGPPDHKPASDCYRGLSLLDDTLEGLLIASTPGTFAVAGRDVAGTKIGLAVLVDRPAAGHETRAEISISNLPWGAAAFELERWRVTQQSSTSGLGVELVSIETLNGPDLAGSIQVAPGDEGLYVWELEQL